MPLLRSWLASANEPDCPFPLNNLPCGVFSDGRAGPRCGIAIGDRVADLAALEAAGVLAVSQAPLFAEPAWNAAMGAGPAVWTELRERMTTLLAAGSSAREAVEPHLVPLDGVQLHMPFKVAGYTDFYASRSHAFNVGTMFHGPEHALPPNWLHIPIGYNGRASSVVGADQGA
ncbi:hypothetical protein M9978_22260 [Sphingomonas sp. MG17]|uniref:Fumarylacetoacetase N-terminal domain-containing protein n=1 Tax=Sphingomonas tagetis TaxID=2949092 RepID=A0A9X2HLG3_9SPHN|nr:hypothetical protein [Sphingomonas tagetis]MCP3733133.1 hypothetical protein [Sphingomonas tagetis]